VYWGRLVDLLDRLVDLLYWGRLVDLLDRLGSASAELHRHQLAVAQLACAQLADLELQGCSAAEKWQGILFALEVTAAPAGILIAP
jgi:hypothetical protein